MILESLLVNNFGVYNGKQNFNLSLNKKKPVILIGALNGSGKTTFLHAIDVVLYGRQSNIFQTSKLSYDNFLKKNINKEKFEEGAQIELSFFRKEKGKLKKYKISRNWKSTSKIKEEFYVFIDDIFNEDITKDWDNYVDQILPARVASLFFFDGEKIEQLADLDKSKEVLKKAVDSLLGLEIVNQLDVDIEEFKRRSSLELKSNEEKIKIEGLEKKALDIKDEIKLIDEELTKVEDELAKINYEYQQLDISLSKKGYDYYKRKKELESEVIEFENNKNIINKDLIKVAAGDAPLLLLKNEIVELLNQSKSISENKNQKEINDNKQIILKDINKFVVENCSDKNFLDKFKSFIEDRSKNKNKILPLENIQEDLNHQEIEFLLEKQLVETSKEIKKKISDLNNINEMYDNKIQQLNKIPSSEEIEPLIEKQKKLNNEKDKFKTRTNVLSDLRSSKNGPLNQINIEIRNLYDDKSKKELINLDNRRFVDYSIKVKDVLSSFHIKVLNHHIKKLEQNILECFNNLHRKKDFAKSIKIDTSTFDLKIFERKNIEVDTNKLSAGERQLLAVAILWGLAKASKSAAPTIIDTPLGRLDSEHRLNLVEKYFPSASNQVILLSTDEEINQKYHKYIKPHLSRSYKIEFDQKINGSIAQEGYFF